MRELLTPDSVYVTFPESDVEGSTQVWSMQTALFRRNTYLPEALDMASGRAPTPDLSVVSAGCSIGAELDSILALHKNGGYDGELTASGYDLNKLAIEMARAGAYKVLFHAHGYKFTQEVLQGLGFDTSYAGQETNGSGELCDRVDVDAAPLRAGFDVDFAEHDLMKPLPSEGADLILANNVLHKIPPGSIKTVMRNLCRALADSGVLAVDAFSLNEKDPRASGAMQVLEGEFGMVPILEHNSAPVILGRE